MNKPKPSLLQLDSGHYIAYNKFTPTETDSPVGIIFMGGFISDMEGSKALFLEKFAKEKNIPFIRFDYFGHGKSSGKFTDGTIGRWKEDALKVIDELTDAPQILIGSSLGGWISLLSAIERPEKIAALIGIAPAPDFTEELIWDVLKPEEKEILQKEGMYVLPSEYCDDPEEDDYPITMNLIEEARSHMLLGNPININCPVRLIHGKKDKDVPYQTSNRIKEKLTSKNVEITFVEDGDHRMSDEKNLEIIKTVLENTLKICKK